MLSDSYGFGEMESEYEMVFRSVIGDYISWKPGTSNALSRWPLTVDLGEEHFACKFRKYQLESMKKFVQATPGVNCLFPYFLCFEHWDLVFFHSVKSQWI